MVQSKAFIAPYRGNNKMKESQVHVHHTLDLCIDAFTRRITLTLFSHQPCPPLSPTHQPQRSLPHSQMTQIRPYSSRTTSISYKLKSTPCVRWHTKHSMPCAFSYSLWLEVVRSPLQLTEIHVISKGAYQPGSSPAHAAGIIYFS